MNVCVRGDLAGGAIQASAASTIGGKPIALRGDAVASHPPCPDQPAHCSASMRTSVASHMNGTPAVIDGDAASCGHSAVSSTGVTITPTPVDPDVRPAAPAAPTVTAGPYALTVTWSEVRLATSYKVQWKTGDQDFDSTRQAVVSGTSWMIPGLEAGTEYTVRVIATRTTAGDGPPSQVATGTPTADEVVLNAPGSSLVVVPRFLLYWRGNFGALQASWFPAGADTTLREIRIDSTLFGGALHVGIAAGNSNFLAGVRETISLTIATAHGSVTVSGIGGSDSDEPYTWVPENSAELQALFQAVSTRRNVAATFTFRRG